VIVLVRAEAAAGRKHDALRRARGSRRVSPHPKRFEEVIAELEAGME
jgi:hypothetical protein